MQAGQKYTGRFANPVGSVISSSVGKPPSMASVSAGTQYCERWSRLLPGSAKRRLRRQPNVFPLPATLLEFLLRAAGHRLIPLGRRGVPDDVARWIVAARC